MKQFSIEANGYNREEVTKQIELMEKTIKKQEKKIKELEEEGNLIIMEAKNDASKIIYDALSRAETTESQRLLLERNIRIFKKKFRLILEQQKLIVDKIDELELKE